MSFLIPCTYCLYLCAVFFRNVFSLTSYNHLVLHACNSFRLVNKVLLCPESQGIAKVNMWMIFAHLAVMFFFLIHPLIPTVSRMSFPSASEELLVRFLLILISLFLLYLRFNHDQFYPGPKVVPTLSCVSLEGVGCVPNPSKQVVPAPLFTPMVSSCTPIATWEELEWCDIPFWHL